MSVPLFLVYALIFPKYIAKARGNFSFYLYFRPNKCNVQKRCGILVYAFISELRNVT